MKKHLLELALKAGGDLGGKSVEHLLNELAALETPRVYIGDSTSDPISAIIYNAIKDNLNFEGSTIDMGSVDTDLQYAINQLQKAKDALKKENSEG